MKTNKVIIHNLKEAFEKISKSTTELDVSDDKFSDDDLKQLLNIVVKHGIISKISIKSHQLKHKSYDVIIKFLKENKRIISFYFAPIFPISVHGSLYNSEINKMMKERLVSQLDNKLDQEIPDQSSSWKLCKKYIKYTNISVYLDYLNIEFKNQINSIHLEFSFDFRCEIKLLITLTKSLHFKYITRLRDLGFRDLHVGLGESKEDDRIQVICDNQDSDEEFDCTIHAYFFRLGMLSQLGLAPKKHELFNILGYYISDHFRSRPTLTYILNFPDFKYYDNDFKKYGYSDSLIQEYKNNAEHYDCHCSILTNLHFHSSKLQKIFDDGYKQILQSAESKYQDMIDELALAIDSKMKNEERGHEQVACREENLKHFLINADVIYQLKDKHGDIVSLRDYFIKDESNLKKYLFSETIVHKINRFIKTCGNYLWKNKSILFYPDSIKKPVIWFSDKKNDQKRSNTNESYKR